MSVDANEELIRRFVEEVMNGLDAEAATEIVAADYVTYHPAFPDGVRGPDGVMQLLGMFRSAFPDLSYRIDDLFATADRAALRWTAEATHQGPFMHVPATGRPIQVSGIDVFQIRDGQIVASWVSSDLLGLLHQIGGLPEPPA